MKFTYIDPLNTSPVHVDSPEVLARQLADQLVGSAKVRFLNEPFPLDLNALKSLLVHLERERLTQRLEFACTVQVEDFNSEAAQLLAKMNFNEIAAPLDLVQANYEAMESFFTAAEEYRLQVSLFLQGTPEDIDRKQLQELYFFLHQQLGKFELVYHAGFFEDVHEDMRFRKLSQISKNSHLVQRFEHYMQEQIYIGFIRIFTYETL